MGARSGSHAETVHTPCAVGPGGEPPVERGHPLGHPGEAEPARPRRAAPPGPRARRCCAPTPAEPPHGSGCPPRRPRPPARACGRWSEPPARPGSPVAATPAGSTACSRPGSVVSRTSRAVRVEALDEGGHLPQLGARRAGALGVLAAQHPDHAAHRGERVGAGRLDRGERAVDVVGRGPRDHGGACAATTIPVTWWATTSCSSRASSIRSAERTSSSAARRRVSTSRNTSPIATAPPQPSAQSRLKAPAALPGERSIGDATIATAAAAVSTSAVRSSHCRSTSTTTTASASSSAKERAKRARAPAL